MNVVFDHTSQYDNQDVRCSYRIGEDGVREMVNELKSLQRDGFLIPNVGDLYLLRCAWYSHPFIHKRSRCDKDNLIMITAVDCVTLTNPSDSNVGTVMPVLSHTCQFVSARKLLVARNKEVLVLDVHTGSLLALTDVADSLLSVD